MNPTPVTHARIDWDEHGTPRAPDYGDIYRPREEPGRQAESVFLGGNGLPARWRGREQFCVLETGFGLGHNFLATRRAWHADTDRPRRLHYVAVELHPPRRQDLMRAHGEAAAELAAAWPAAVEGLHLLHFEHGALTLLLAFGDVQRWLPALQLRADAVFLDGFAPDRNPAMWNRRVFDNLARRCAPGATAATWSVARDVRDGLSRGGFAVQRVAGGNGKREVLHARFEPRFPVADAPTRPRRVAVIGAGIAGASVAAALARDGAAVTVLERHAVAAAEASGNPAGIFHGVVHPDDGPHARLLRAGAMHTARSLAPLLASGRVRGSTAGLLRLERDPLAAPAMQALLQRLGLPAEHVDAVDAARASELAGLPIDRPAWWYPDGGWVSPPDWVAQALRTPGVDLLTAAPVQGWTRRADGELEVRGADGRVLVCADALVIAAADGAADPMLAPLLAGTALQRVRGQVSWTEGPCSGTLRIPVASDGYALPLPDGRLLFGATSDADDPDPALRESDQCRNLERLRRMLPTLDPAAAPGALQGRVGWRLKTGDRLPLAGPLPQVNPATPSDRLARWPREPGVFVLTALGSRGLSLAPLLGELLAAQIRGTPWPLAQDLADAVDPARFLVRAFRRR